MPLGKKVRPGSAAGKLETYTITSIFHNATPVTAKTATSRISSTQARARTSIPESRVPLDPVGCQAQVEQCEHPLKQHPRRHSLGLSQNIATSENIQRFGDTIKSLRKGKIEQKVSLTHLKNIQAAFEEFESDGRSLLDVKAFKLIMKKCLGYRGIHDDQIEELFRKIDYSANGQIGWDEFCTFMQLKYQEIEESYVRSKHISFSLPATVRMLSHAEQILRIYFTPDETFIMMREAGTVSFWTSQLKLKRSRRLFEKSLNRKPKWITDFAVMYQYNKFILSTGDREIQIYELSTFEPYCQITGSEACPLQLDYCSGADDCMILYGDDQGCVNILLLSSVAETLRTWKKCPKVDNFPSISIENSVLSPNVTYIRWKVHEDWVTQLKYYDSMTAVITASSHEATALVIGCTTGTTNLEKQMKEMKECWKEGKTTKSHGPCVPQKRLACDQSVFPVHKGVKTFDLRKNKNLLVTGGMDRIVRMWNPYIPGKPTGLLRGHCAPICFLCISTDDNKLFSVSTDNTVKIWDTEDQCCLYTANQKASRVTGNISTCLYVSAIKALCIAADAIALLHLRIQPQPQPHHIKSHKEPVLCCIYCSEFRQIISCSEESVIKVWDLDTGKLVFEFSGAHGDSAICCMAFDDSGRRLITGGRDGCVKIWNHNNGHCLKILKKEGRCDEICDCTYVEMHKNNYVLAVGWDRRINIYCDSFDDLHHVQPPQPYWQDDLEWGHKDDILCIAQCPPTLLATSSYDGETIVWNMISGHICCHLQNPTTKECRDGEAVTDKSVNKVMFLKTRALKIDSGASLVTTGSQVLNYWRAHVSSITCMELIEEQNLMVTSAFEGTVRLWSMDGELIGTFGQPPPWDIYAPASWMHPMVPYDILVDPLSLPIHPLLEEEASVTQHVNLSQSEENKQIMTSKNLQHSSSKMIISDEEIKEKIKKMTSQNNLGKRLRQERYKRLNRPINHGGPSAYHTLNYFEISTPNPCEKPDLSTGSTDPYDICFKESTVDLQACA
ncbi:cilia- and flagella-associated protein 337 isoform X3 [Mobula birostris]|uniref:cilia- and flagella-associated protein 337 isoform X3 n=1 Tax=Mobula birostris TaxID=1983395 RepID=UPI003B27C3C4